MYQIIDHNTNEQYTMTKEEIIDMAVEFESLDNESFKTNDINEAINILDSFNITVVIE